ncbi:dihydrofolate reductase family protein [Nonomuraea sp. NBC_00507]|uniref:dihydrofolate reductase family protein n=1 Tax=Nonomuraea sp. NBC_00507 TaxID=2976002 RepID=UPI002E176B56
MKLTTVTHVTIDGVMQGNGGASDEDRRNGFERGGWAPGAGDDETRTFITPRWEDTTVLRGDLAAAISELKAKPGAELQVHGSGILTRWLLENDLVDEMMLIVIPVILGQGARLFPETGPDLALDLVESRVDSKGVTIQVYRPAGRAVCKGLKSLTTEPRCHDTTGDDLQMRYLVSVIDDKSNPGSTDRRPAISAFNERLITEGYWVFAGGLADTDAATVIDNRGEQAVFSDGPFVESKEYLAGVWVWEAPDLDVALKLAAEASKVCDRKIEVRPFL